MSPTALQQHVEILRPRQAVVAIGNERQRDVVGRQQRDQLQRMACRHVGVGQALAGYGRGNGCRSARSSPGLPCRPRSARACRCKARRNSPTAPRRSPSPLRSRFCASVSDGSTSSVAKSGAGASSTRPTTLVVAGLAQFLHHAQRDPGAHRRADQDLLALGETPEHGEAFAKPFRDCAVGKGAAGFAMAGIIVAQEGAAFSCRPVRQRLGLRAQHVGFVAAEPDDAGRRARRMARPRCWFPRHPEGWGGRGHGCWSILGCGA